jgi:hypothetical protein
MHDERRVLRKLEWVRDQIYLIDEYGNDGSLGGVGDGLNDLIKDLGGNWDIDLNELYKRGKNDGQR